MGHILRDEQVALLACEDRVTMPDPSGARLVAAALHAAARVVAEHRDLPALSQLTVQLLEGRTERAHVVVDAQVVVGDLPAVAAWADAGGSPITVEPVHSDPHAVGRYRCSTLVDLPESPFAPAASLRVWTVVRAPTGAATVDRLLGLYLGDRVGEHGEPLAVAR